MTANRDSYESLSFHDERLAREQDRAPAKSSTTMCLAGTAGKREAEMFLVILAVRPEALFLW
jgi:hypothetical protein